MLAQVILNDKRDCDSTLQLNYAVGSYCFRVVQIMLECDWLTLKEVDRFSLLSIQLVGRTALDLLTGVISLTVKFLNDYIFTDCHYEFYLNTIVNP